MHRKSGTLLRLGCVVLFGALALLASPAMAAEDPPCPPVPNLENHSVTVDTKTAVDAIGKLLGRLGIDINVRDTRDNVLKNNPRADQVVIVLTMANIYCKMIWSDTALKGEDKASHFRTMMQELLTPAAGPTPVARTGATGWIRSVTRLASNDTFAVADTETPALPKPQTGFLRDPPFLINDYNKYFVIVGSAATREEGLRLMNSLKSKAPQYDFALYEPYGDNPNFGIMMASWVPLDVAQKALGIARRTVAKDAFLWACRSTGSSC
ncbi:hypothetical protein G8O24_39845 [Bradyrhizobium sp. INPA01-394B]|uniref:SPOR domain-containing protein n=1 Tax=Bradyrhizobium campsiandrae TaxID=1729892 RepID=A0ABR7TZF3_9BRAD|nr:hypothetical protein [Bradyrhizobium campsiandrae]MBC9883443.1 hypothetical protein [Bradyrhizobium campsiandrae]MBC9976681.1 hypothetical protein [Bradyrhizobium campsiandrae]